MVLKEEKREITAVEISANGAKMKDKAAKIILRLLMNILKCLSQIFFGTT